MTLSVGAMTLDCNDVSAVAGFWSAALGLPLDAQEPAAPRPDRG